MARLFDELLAISPELHTSPQGRHALNIFFTRLLFCFFAENTGIFDKKLFTDAIGTLSQTDGSDLNQLLTDIFTALETADATAKPAHLAKFPYVNGRLFTIDQHHTVPTFNKRTRDLVLDSGRLLWNEINPDIFGSMFQAVVTPGQRSDLGQHYTSVPNILKTIEPLFLDRLKEEFNAGFDSARKLEAVLRRISQIKVFDPACGSGNFLVIAYKELRKLEHAILERLRDLRGGKHQSLMLGSRINIENFFGIELDDFAVEVAILSLWIAKHQMNVEFREKFGIDLPLIPLKETGQIRQGNAARVDWQAVCPNTGTEEIFLIGNPPYAGAKVQTKDQKADYGYVFDGRQYSKNLDYIALWFVKGADYIAGTRAELAFVTTNSVSQGEHVGLMFPMVFDKGLEIGFAYTSSKWENNAKRNAGVTVAVINLRNARAGAKFIYTSDLRIEVANINGYLAGGDNEFVTKRFGPLSLIPPMSFGSMPNDNGKLILSAAERGVLVSRHPDTEQLVKRYTGSIEHIGGIERYALWISSSTVGLALGVPEIVTRIDAVREHRKKSDRASTKKLADVPWRFGEVRYKPTESIIVPRVSSENREYIPIGYLDKEAVISDAANAVYDAEAWVFALLTSQMHMVWTRAVAGRLKTDFRYSATIVYNNFPVPDLSTQVKDRLANAALRVLDVREYHSEKTLAELYDPDLMPDDLRLAHRELDELVDSIYRKHGFNSDEERLSLLFDMYKQMTAEEKRL